MTWFKHLTESPLIMSTIMTSTILAIVISPFYFFPLGVAVILSLVTWQDKESLRILSSMESQKDSTSCTDSPRLYIVR